MRSARFIILMISLSFALAATSVAGEVRVFKPKEEDVSPMELRNQAMAEGFALAVLEEAKPMLPHPLNEVRTELFKEYLLSHGKPYVLGYNVLSSQSMEAGLILRMNVIVNKKTLRQGLKRMGFFATSQSPLAASIAAPDDLNEEATTQLKGLITLTGVQVSPGVLPSFTLESGPEKTWKARLLFQGREFVSVNKDMAEAWYELWARYFTRSEAKSYQTSTQGLSINGWFSPDGVLEFDRILRSWDSAVQEVSLVEMDMQPAGVGARWNVRILNMDRLNMMLQAYLPQRGLSYQLSENAD